MRILQLTTSFPLQESSLSGIFIHRLISHFPKEIDIVVLTPSSRYPISVFPDRYRLVTFSYALKRMQILAHEPGGVPVALKKNPFLFLLVPVFFLSMLWHVIRESRNIDIIHAHWAHNGIIAAIAGLLTRKPVITTIHGEDATRAATSKIQNFLFRLCCKMSDCITMVSDAMYKKNTERYNEFSKKMFFIPMGASDSLFSLVSKKNKNSSVQLLALGTLIRRKGVEKIIIALTLCKNKNWKLVIAGSGEEQEKLQHIVSAQHLDEKIKFIGTVPPDDVVSLMSETDILIQASYSEGRPSAVIEAMAAAIPVVGSDIDGINELIEHGKNGLLFPAGNAEALAEQLDTLIAAPELRKNFGLAGRKTLLEQNLTWNKCAAAYLSLYKRLIKETNA